MKQQQHQSRVNPLRPMKYEEVKKTLHHHRKHDMMRTGAGAGAGGVVADVDAGIAPAVAAAVAE